MPVPSDFIKLCKNGFFLVTKLCLVNEEGVVPKLCLVNEEGVVPKPREGCLAVPK